MSTIEANLQPLFHTLTSKSFISQAKWFMNGFWDDISSNPEFFWKCVHLCHTISKNKLKGTELDEFEAHRFLEQLGETLSVAEMREKLRIIDVDFNKHMALIEYFIFKYNKTVKEVVYAPQGGQEEIKKAQSLVELSQASFDEVNRQLENQKAALAEQKSAEEEALSALESAQAKESSARIYADVANAKAIEARENETDALSRKSEAEAAAAVSKQAQDASTSAADEQRQALNDLKILEDSFAAKVAELESKSESGPIVQRGRAKAELEQLKSGDSLPLRRAKINQEAAVRRFGKAQQRATEEAEKSEKASSIAKAAATLASESRLQSEEASKQATQSAHASSLASAAAVSAAHNAQAARLESEKVAEQLEVAFKDCDAKLQEAKHFLVVAKNMPGSAQGDIWWLNRELDEKMKYLPQSQQKARN